MSHTILICDDASYMRTLMGDILTGAGFEVVGEAETGAQALEQYKRLRPDIVTLDVLLRGIGGLDAAREICKFDHKAKVLMCSAIASQEMVAEAIEAGAKEFVVKPFQPNRLLEAVRNVLT